jgi:hypothetical protein
LVLRGQVPTFYVKQVAQAIVCSVCRFEEVIDQIEVAAVGASLVQRRTGREFSCGLPAKPR